MSQTILPTDLYVNGNVSAKTISLPASTVTDTSVIASAGIQASKLQHQYEDILAQGSAVAATAQTQTVHAVKGATATIVDFSAGAIVVAIGADTCTVDCKKNGTTILTGTISLTNAQSARQLVQGSLSVTSAVAGDVFEVVITPNHTSGTLANGIFCRLTIREDAQ